MPVRCFRRRLPGQEPCRNPAERVPSVASGTWDPLVVVDPAKDTTNKEGSSSSTHVIAFPH